MKWIGLLLILVPVCSYAQDGYSFNAAQQQAAIQQMQQEQQRQAQQQQQQQEQQRQAQQEQQRQAQQQQQDQLQQQEHARQQQSSQAQAQRQSAIRAAEQQRLQLEQQRMQQEHMRLEEARRALAAQRAMARQQTIDRVREYRNNGLQSQVDKAIRDRTLSAAARKGLQDLKKDLLDKTWWHQQDAALLTGLIASYTNATAMLVFDMLGFDLTGPVAPVASIGVSAVDNALIKWDFSVVEAGNVIKEAAIAEKVTAGDPLAKAVNIFRNFGMKVGASTELPGSHKEMRKEIAVQLQNIDKEIKRYDQRIQQANQILDAQAKLNQTLDRFLEQNGGQ